MLPFTMIKYGNIKPVNVVGQVEYSTASGTYYFTVPANVYSICAVLVGSGQGNKSSTVGGNGGDLRYRNNITVQPSEILRVIVGAAPTTLALGNSTYLYRQSTNELLLLAKGGGSAQASTTIALPDIGGGNGGVTSSAAYGGAGAGGYSGVGGNPGAYGTGGGGGGGTMYNGNFGAQGGGVGLYGQGANGAGGVSGTYPAAAGKGGSGGADGTGPSGAGGTFGGGGGASTNTYATNGARGGVRIIWGNGRSFPSTGTTNQ